MKTPTTAQRITKDAPRSTLAYKAQGPTLDQFHRQDQFIKGLIGPIGSGKTYAAIFELLMKAHNQPVNLRKPIRQSRWVVARNSYPDLLSATIPDFRAVTDQLPFGKFTMGNIISWKAEYQRSDGTKVDVEVLFKSFDGDQDVKKAKGLQLTGVWVDELSEFHKSNFDMLIGRVGRYPSKVSCPTAWSGVIFTTNACPRDHWLAKLALDHTPENWWVGVQPGGILKSGNQWLNNPKAENVNNLPKDYYLRQVDGKKESWVRQMLANEFVHHSDGRPIHPDFNEQLHVSDLKATSGMPLYLGMDWGRTPACVICQQQPNGQWYVLEEIVLVNCGADRLGETVKRVLNARYDGYSVSQATGDPSGTAMAQTQDETPFDLFALRSGLTGLPAHTNDFEVRVATLDNLLTKIVDGQPAIMIDRSCHSLIGGLSGEYQFRRIQVAGSDRYHDKPDKGPTSHVVESLHYCLMGAGESEVLFDSQWDSVYTDLDELLPDYRMFE